MRATLHQRLVLVSVLGVIGVWPGDGSPQDTMGQAPEIIVRSRTSTDRATHETGDDPWLRAAPGYLFRFPADHFSHPPFKIEWWYYTGNVATADGRRFGYQLTFFRVGMAFEPSTPSRWAVRDLYMAHLAATDIESGSFRFADRVNRGTPWYAGADDHRYRVWNEGWEAWLEPDGHHRLRASDAAVALDLTLAPGKPPVIHGERGISQKGARPGNATHYYSLTRMPTRGSLTINGKRHAVEGSSWMDHEFGTSLLEPDQVGWDWFSLQFDDGADLMVFQLRRRDGARDPHSSGTMVERTGEQHAIRFPEFTLVPGRTWTSPSTGASYPVSWRLSVPGRPLELDVTATVAGQELDTRRSTGIAYWEGAVTVTGADAGRPLTGRGYLEMTGYSGPGLGSILR